MSAHTPGPWAVRFSLSGYPYQIIAVNGDDKAPGKVGTCITRWASIMLPSSAEARANACLIAAAPDLLAALRTALTQLELLGGVRRKHPNEGQDEIHAAVLETVDAAIAKALMRGTP